jgi:hypothetical protein
MAGFEYAATSPLEIERRCSELVEWCNENIGDEFELWAQTSIGAFSTSFVFTTSSGAALFKLKFSDLPWTSITWWQTTSD